MWASYFHCVLEHVPALESPFRTRHALYALVEVEGSDDASDRERLERALTGALQAGEIADAAVAQSEREAKAFWAIRDAIGEVTPKLHPMLGFDVSLPLDAMRNFCAHLDVELARFA